MLKGIPSIISPELLKVLQEMGHGSEICIGDGNFPGAQFAKQKGAIIVRADGHSGTDIMKAILTLMPLDTYVASPVKLMEKVPGDSVETPIWGEYADIIAEFDERGKDAIQHIERFKFYDHAADCYCIVQTGEKALYANYILKKGVIK